MRIFENANFKFVENRTRGYIVSGVLILASLMSLGIRGLELGIDFRGGMEFAIETDSPLDATEVRSGLGGILGTEPEVKTFGSNALLIRTLPTAGISEMQNLVVTGFRSLYPDSNPVVLKTDVVGPRFAKDLARGAIYSILGSLLVIFVYVLLRFEWRFGVGAVVALFHDVTITLGAFSALHHILPFSLQIDQTLIAAFLTIVGYSLNDTVVVFDRIREYTGLFKTDAYHDVVNKSINNTLSRTIITSGTTLLVVLVLFIFGGEVLRGFAFALMIGVLIGTYSSVFVAAPVVIELRDRFGKATGR
ncbi:MAG: preprotein translocase subunit SecF [Thalassolituus oleivorans]|jgi:preprotein translocase subunit SecF